MKPNIVLFYFAAITILAALSIAEPSQTGGGTIIVDEGPDPDAKELQKEGIFTLTTNPNNEDFKNYLAAMEYNGYIQTILSKTKKFIITIKKLDGGKYYGKIENDLYTREMTFESGKEFDTELPDGRIRKDTITMNFKDKTMHRVIKLKDYDVTHDLVFNKKGFTLSLKAQSSVATLNFEDSNTKPVAPDWADLFARWG